MTCAGADFLLQAYRESKAALLEARAERLRGNPAAAATEYAHHKIIALIDELRTLERIKWQEEE